MKTKIKDKIAIAIENFDLPLTPGEHYAFPFPPGVSDPKQFCDLLTQRLGAGYRVSYTGQGRHRRLLVDCLHLSETEIKKMDIATAKQVLRFGNKIKAYGMTHLLDNTKWKLMIEVENVKPEPDNNKYQISTRRGEVKIYATVEAMVNDLQRLGINEIVLRFENQNTKNVTTRPNPTKVRA